MTTSLRLVSGFNGLMAVTIVPGQFFAYDNTKRWSLISCALSSELAQLVANEGIAQVRFVGWAGAVNDTTIFANEPIFTAVIASAGARISDFKITPPSSGQEVAFRLYNADTGAQIRLDAGTSIAHMVFSYGGGQ